MEDSVGGVVGWAVARVDQGVGRGHKVKVFTGVGRVVGQAAARWYCLSTARAAGVQARSGAAATSQPREPCDKIIEITSIKPVKWTCVTYCSSLLGENIHLVCLLQGVNQILCFFLKILCFF